MTFRKFAFNNIYRNKRLYAAYFLSSLFTVMVFFTFAIFAYHPELGEGHLNGNVRFGMNTAAGIIYVFSFFFVLYSMSSFLHSRKREFGLLMLQGMSMRQIPWMVFLENMIIGFFATLGGILLGLVFAKAILLLAENALVLESRLYFYFPGQAVKQSLICFLALFFCISVFVSYVLRSRKLIELIKGDKQSKGEPKANLLLTLAAVLLLGSGYAGALIVKGLGVIAALVPVVCVVTAGTYLLFTQLSVYVIRRLKKRESFFWRKTNMLLFADLSFRMKDNARTFFMVAMVSTTAFSAIGTLYGFQSFATGSTKIAYPNTLVYKEDEFSEQHLAVIREALRKAGIQGEEAAMTMSYYDIGGRRTMIAKQSDYNRFAALIGEDAMELGEGEAAVVEFAGLPYGQAGAPLSRTIGLPSGEALLAERTVNSRALPGPFYYVVPDAAFERLPAPVDARYYHAWQSSEEERHMLAVVRELLAQLPPNVVTSVDYEVYRMNKDYAPVLFVGLFVGLVFFVSAGSFLYFRLYMDLDGDKQKFGSIAKLGLSDKELGKVLTKQLAILFFAPIVVALIHGAVALTALSHMFFYNLVVESAVVLGVFLVIQVLYFFVVRYFYTAQIRSAIA